MHVQQRCWEVVHEVGPAAQQVWEDRRAEFIAVMGDMSTRLSSVCLSCTAWQQADCVQAC